MSSEIEATSRKLSFIKSRPIRFDILTFFVSLLVITVLVIVLYGYQRNTKAVLEITEEIIHEVEELVIKEATLFLEPVESIVRLSTTLAAGYGFSLPSDQNYEIYAITVIEEFPQIEMFNMADKMGNFMMLKSMPDGTIATKIIDRSIDSPVVTWKYRNKLGEVVRTESTHWVDFDPRGRTWYQGAKKKGGTFWTDVYIFHTDKKPGITASHPVITEDGKFLGVFGLDIELGRMSDFLKKLRIGKSGIAFIINAKGEVIAYPGISSVIASQEKDIRSISVEELKIDQITAFYKNYQENGRKRFVFEAGGEEYIGSIIDFPKEFSGSWKLSIIVPENDFLGPIKKTRQIVITISVFVLLIAIGLAVLLSKSISRPILNVARETERIKAFQLEGEKDISSRIKEIQILDEAMKRMKVSLKSFTRFAPEEIVREVVAEGKEAILGGEKREVTLLFCDLRGFTMLSEKKRPVEIVSLLNNHFDAMVRLISKYRGFVIDFQGDSVFAAFGALALDPDHAEHGVRCAIEMQLERQRLNESNRAMGLPILEMGIGLNTGICLVGNMGSTMRIKYGVLGHAVNLSARIESFTAGGQIMISAVTHDIVKNIFSMQGPLEGQAKGIAGSIQIWEVLGVKGHPTLRLPPVVPKLKVLTKPLPVTIKLIRGKQIIPESKPAHLIKLAQTGCEVKLKQNLNVHSAIIIQLGLLPEDRAASIEGKIVGTGTEDRAVIVRFSPMDKKQSDAIGRLVESSIIEE
jgi:adenylate cyclase